MQRLGLGPSVAYNAVPDRSGSQRETKQVLSRVRTDGPGWAGQNFPDCSKDAMILTSVRLCCVMQPGLLEPLAARTNIEQARLVKIHTNSR